MTGTTEVDGWTLSEAATLLSGADMATTHALPDRQVDSVRMSDGPHGLAMNLPDWSGKVPATCFPAATALAATWDTALVERVAHAIGREAKQAGADLLLGPGINIKRSPLGGRGFEYYSEDPYVTGRIGAAFVRGVQAAGVGACLKHYAVNSQETDRMRVSAEVSERGLREIYLAAFEHIVRTAEPAAVMASYNRVNGEYVSQSRRLLTEILRDEWGFGGAVISDWGAVDDRVQALTAGLDLEMPGTGTVTRDQVLDAVAAGTLDETQVRASAARIVDLAHRWGTAGPDVLVDESGHHDLAVEAAASAMVLLSNDGTLPLAATNGGHLLVVGAAAESPRLQGAGSSGVEVRDTQSPVDAIRAATDRAVRFEAGYLDPSYPGDDGSPPPASGLELADRAVRAAAEAHDVVVFAVGDAESEGFDRSSMTLPAEQIELIDRLVEANPRTVIVLNNGGVLQGDTWTEGPAAILEAWLPGQGYGPAVAGILFGSTNPSGKLPETIPISVEDTPTFLDFPGVGGRTFHGEGVFVGYRGYDRAGTEVAFPFGHGLSYTTFEYADLEIGRVADRVAVSFTLTNTGERPGSEVWQVYVEPPVSAAPRPLRTLAAFGKVRLDPGETVRVETVVEPRELARWDDRREGWCIDGGAHGVLVGSSSRDVRLSADVHLLASGPASVLSERSTLREWTTDPEVGRHFLDAVVREDPSGATIGFISNPVVLTMIGDMPICRLFGDPSTRLSSELLDLVLDRAARS